MSFGNFKLYLPQLINCVGFGLGRREVNGVVRRVRQQGRQQRRVVVPGDGAGLAILAAGRAGGDVPVYDEEESGGQRAFAVQQ
jgi:hypothetical protein